MNKLTKAAIAGAAGIALLLGGAGSLAYWNVSSNVGSTSINSGSLAMTSTAGVWNNTYTKWVPGDSSTYTGSVTVTAAGDNFKGDFTVDKSSLTTGNELAQALDITLTVTGTLPAGVTLVSPGVYKITGAGTFVLPVTVKVQFPYGAVIDNTTMTKTVALTDIKFNVKQTTP